MFAPEGRAEQGPLRQVRLLLTASTLSGWLACVMHVSSNRPCLNVPFDHS